MTPVSQLARLPWLVGTTTLALSIEDSPHQSSTLLVRRNGEDSSAAAPSCAARTEGRAHPSQIRTAARSMSANAAAGSVPIRCSSFASGTVTRFCASNAPRFKNGTSLATSKLDARVLVVCGTTVTRARSPRDGVPRASAIIEDVLLEVMYEIPSITDIERCVVTEDYVLKTPPDARGAGVWGPASGSARQKWV